MGSRLILVLALVVGCCVARGQSLIVRASEDESTGVYVVTAEVLNLDLVTGGGEFNVLNFFNFQIVTTAGLSEVTVAPVYQSAFFGFVADAATGEMKGCADTPPLGTAFENENPSVLGTFTLAPGSQVVELIVMGQLAGVYDGGDFLPTPFFFQRSDGAAGDFPFAVFVDREADPCNGPPQVDCNANGVDDLCELLTDPSVDCDGNSLIDACEIALDPSQDCDGDGILDLCALADGLVEDCNNNGQVDTCELAADPSIDCNGDGAIDTCQIALNQLFDCDRNGIPDECELAADPSLDCDEDGFLDRCQVLQLPDIDDCNRNGIVDACDIAADPTLDADMDGVIDGCPGGTGCSIADVNNDGRLTGADFNAWLMAFAAGSSAADQNGDGILNGGDFNAWLTNFASGICG